MTNDDDHAMVWRLYGRPLDFDAMRKSLVDTGESLRNAAEDLSRDCTPARCDEMLARLAGAAEAVRHLRRALAQGVMGHGTG